MRTRRMMSALAAATLLSWRPFCSVLWLLLGRSLLLGEARRRAALLRRRTTTLLLLRLRRSLLAISRVLPHLLQCHLTARPHHRLRRPCLDLMHPVLLLHLPLCLGLVPLVVRLLHHRRLLWAVPPDLHRLPLLAVLRHLHLVDGLRGSLVRFTQASHSRRRRLKTRASLPLPDVYWSSVI